MAKFARTDIKSTNPPINHARHTIIGVIANNVGGYSRGVIRGVARYAFSRAWVCRVQGVNQTSIADTIGDFHGLVIQAATPSQVRSLSQVDRIPVVNISSAVELQQFPSVVSDDLAIGQMGADYFVRIGFRHFAFYAPDSRAFSKLRHEGFANYLLAKGLTPQFIATETALRSALPRLPKPTAMMACNDLAALTVLDTCHTLSIKIPDEIAVLGVDNDDLVQSLAYPPLSTINTARERIGFEAAAMLEGLIKNRNQKSRITRVPPKGVIERLSTATTAITDPDVASACRYIHANAGLPIDVSDVLDTVLLSRRQLERKFKISLNRSILDEIVRRRIDRARELLADTELTLPQIALASGFTSASYFSVVFHKMTGTTPGAYRTNFYTQT